MQDVYDYINNHTQETVDLLVRLCRQPSISAQRLGLHEMAPLTSDVLRETGLDVRLEPTKTGIPVVYGDLNSSAASRTVLIYNHYDEFGKASCRERVCQYV